MLEKKGWNELVKKHAPPFGAFLQSWEWGEFQRQIGHRVDRVYKKEGKTEIIAQAIKMPLPFGQYYWYLPKGPLGNMPHERMVASLISEIPDAMFFRMEPEDTSRLLSIKDVQPSSTVILDLEKSEEELLEAMKSKTRYNIRLAEKRGVKCEIVSPGNFEDFARLLDQTTNRDQFKAHPESYYRNMLHVLKGKTVKAQLAIASFEGRPLAANIILDFAGVRTYLHGATSNLHRNTMPQYGLHWFLIKDAKAEGLTSFDFWGVAPQDSDPSHSWAGISRYKKGFGGKVISMPGTVDLPQKHIWYSLYKTVKKLRR